MQIRLERKNAHVHFEATNSEGNSIDIDGSPAIGGQGNGMRPMETVLAGVAACSVMDLVSIIKKQRMDLEHVSIDVQGDRLDAVPSPFTHIRLHFQLTGNLDEAKCRKAVALSVEKYCSAVEMLKSSVDISHSFEIIPSSKLEEQNSGGIG